MRVKSCLPNFVHKQDKSGKVLYVFDLGHLNLGELFDTCSIDDVVTFFAMELEKLITESDSLILIVDLKGAKLKDLSNKQANAVFRALMLQVTRFYPQLLDRCYVLNTPMFFPDYWDS